MAIMFNRMVLVATSLFASKHFLAGAVTTSVEHFRYIEASDHSDLFSLHSFCERLVDLGEIRMNYATAGSEDKPALLLIPGQTESWWGYEVAMWLLKDSYQVYAVDLRGQGRPPWTTGRYSLDNFGDDLVHFIDIVIGRPVVVSGLSSGGVISAWLSAFAKPGQIRAAVYEDPPLFASETKPAVGHSVRQTVAGPLFEFWYKWLGGQWTIGNLTAMYAAEKSELPVWILQYFGNSTGPSGLDITLEEYDPEWGSAFASGSVGVTCGHRTMLTQVKTPDLFSHHARFIDPTTGNLLGATSDIQAQYVRDLITENGNQSFTLKSFPNQMHNMHSTDPATYVTTITKWMASLGIGPAVTPNATQIEAASSSASAIADCDIAYSRE